MAKKGSKKQQKGGRQKVAKKTRAEPLTAEELAEINKERTEVLGLWRACDNPVFAKYFRDRPLVNAHVFDLETQRVFRAQHAFCSLLDQYRPAGDVDFGVKHWRPVESMSLYHRQRDIHAGEHWARSNEHMELQARTLCLRDDRAAMHESLTDRMLSGPMGPRRAAALHARVTSHVDAIKRIVGRFRL